MSSRDRTAFVILGPHRSGTSALTRVLSLCGLSLPARVLRMGPPSDSNSRHGFWESESITLLNDRILEAANMHWSYPASLPDDWFASETALAFREELSRAIEEEFVGERQIVLKDPRISRLLPLFHEALAGAGFDTRWIICLRNPLESAASLTTRDHFSTEIALRLWLSYLLEAELRTRNRLRTFVAFEDLLDNWEATVGSLGEDLSWKPRIDDGVRREVGSFLDQKSRHYRFSDEELKRGDIPLNVQVAHFYFANHPPGLSGDPLLDVLREAYAAPIATDSPHSASQTKNEPVAQQSSRDHEIDSKLEGLSTAIGRLEAKLDNGPSTNQLAKLERKVSLALLRYQEATLAPIQDSAKVLRPTVESGLESIQDELHSLRSRVVRLGTKKSAGDRSKQTVPSRVDGERRWLRLSGGLQDLGLQLDIHSRLLEQILSAEVRTRRSRERYGLAGSLLPRHLWGILPKGTRRRLRDIEAIEASGCFSGADYRRANPDLPPDGLDPLYHYVRFGASEGRPLGPGLDASFLSTLVPALDAANGNPLAEVIRAGKQRAVLEHIASPHLHSPTAEASSAGDRIRVPTQSTRETASTRNARKRNAPRVLAFYLPQFHPIPENDRWWGKGFTEWHNVVRGRPFFKGHEQPLLPSELGFYDLRLKEVQHQQAALASQHGIDGFCYYVYWFGGRRLLDRPLEALLEDDAPDFPFCLCWANEHWTRRWDGEDNEILVEQRHHPDSDAEFLWDMLPFLLDPRYIRCDDRPMLLVYRADLLSDPMRTTRRWRQIARRSGLPDLYLVTTSWHVSDPTSLGFDAVVDFPPHSVDHARLPLPPDVDRDFKGLLFDYQTAAQTPIRKGEDHPIFPGVMPCWDNTARRQEEAHVFAGSSPELYREWLERALLSQSSGSHDRRFVFINAWNEWAEGAVLEPTKQHGRAYLEATRDAIYGSDRRPPSVREAASTDKRKSARRQSLLLVSHDAAPAGAQTYLLALGESLAREHDFEVSTLLLAGGELESSFARLGKLTNLELASSDPGTDSLQRFLDHLSALPSIAICNTCLSANAAVALSQRAVPVVSIVHELPTTINAVSSVESLYNLLESSALSLTVSEFVRKALCQEFVLPSDAFRVLHAGSPRQPGPESPAHGAEMRRRLGISAEGILVLGCGTIHNRKGPDLFVQIAHRVLSETATPLHFVWVGGDQESTTLRLWCQHDLVLLGISEHVDFVGASSTPEDYYAAADIFLLPSREDPFPLVLLEAMAFGLPSVAFEGAGGASEALARGGGLLAPYLDVRAAARELLKLVEADTFRAEKSRQAHDLAATDFSWRRFARDISALLHETVHGDPKRRELEEAEVP